MKRSMLLPTGILIVFYLVGVYAPPPEEGEHVSTREPEPTETYANTENTEDCVEEINYTSSPDPRNSSTEVIESLPYHKTQMNYTKTNWIVVHPNLTLTTPPPPPPPVETILNFTGLGQFLTNHTWGRVKNRVIEGRSAVKDAIDGNIISKVYKEFGAAMQEIAVLQSSRRDSVYEDGAELVELMGYMLRFFEEPVFIYASAINKLGLQVAQDLRTLNSLNAEQNQLNEAFEKDHQSLINAQIKLHVAHLELDYCRNVTNINWGPIHE